MEILANTTTFVYQTIYDELNDSSSRHLYLSVEPDTLVPPVGYYNQTLLTTSDNGQEDEEKDHPRNNRGPSLGQSLSSSWSWPLLVVVGGLFPLATIAGGLVTCLAVAWDRRLHHTLFYFSASLSALQIVMAATVMPPALLVTWQGRYNCSDRECKLWITADLFFCNGACLNLAFICMDAFLRLKDPLRHGNATVSAWSLTVWLSAPWSVSLVQSVAQFILSMADANSRGRDGLCFIADRNFVILGTLFSYVIPVFVATSFLVLSRAEVRRLRRRVLCDTGNGGGGAPVHVEEALTEREEEEARLRGQGKVQVRYTHHQEEEEEEEEDLAWNLSDSTSIDSDQQEVEGGCPTSQGVMTTTRTAKPERLLQESNRRLNDDRSQTSYKDDDQSLAITFEDSASFHEDFNFRSGHSTAALQGPSRGKTSRFCDETSRKGQLKRTPLTPRSQVLLKGRVTTPCSPRILSPTPAADDFQIIPDQALRREISLCQLVQILVVIHALLWLPFSVSNIVYSVCRECRHTMTFAQGMTFKWMAYSSAPLGALANCCLSTQIRRSFSSLVVTLVQTIRRRLKTLVQ